MKNLKIKALSFAFLILILFFLTLLKLYKLDDLYFYSAEKLELNKIPFVAMVNLIVSLLVIIFFERRLDFWTVFNFAWVFVAVFIFNLIFISYHDYKRVDYLFSEKVENFKIVKFEEEKFNINTQFIIDKYTLHYNQNRKIKTIYDGGYNLYKSRFQKYYYLKAVQK